MARDLSRIEIRPLETLEDFRACVELQRETWGSDFTELVPLSILKVSREMGGVAAGAFDAEGRLVGFVFGISGLRNGRLAHWSDMLAVRGEARGLGLGRKLKAYQREELLGDGIEVVYWTYDPLVARNAHLNINRLGARPVEYVVNMYGEDTSSPLHEGLGTDRFIVEWELTHPRVERALAGEAEVETTSSAPDEMPVVNAGRRRGEPEPGEPKLSDAPAVRVEVPHDIQRIQRDSPSRAAAWREATRHAFLRYMERDYRVTGFMRDAGSDRCFYVLARDGEPEGDAR